MKKIFNRLLIYMICGSEDKTEQIMDIIYSKNKSLKKPNDLKFTETKKEIKDSKQELLDSLSYLKNKKLKTKQDKESIYTLEMVLKNMK
jgi:hypothetical protein